MERKTMKSALDCVPCFVDHALHVAQMVTEDPEKQFEIVKRALAEVSKMNLDMAPPEMARTIHGIIKEVAGIEDAYREVKDKSTDFALKLLPALYEDLKKFDDDFEARIRLTIAGNIIDFGADRRFDLDTAHERITEVMTMAIDIEAIKFLKQRMDKAKNIFYIADNCGEAVFDRLLIEKYKDKITLGVRGFPILNDITPREVPLSGLDSLVKNVIDTGDSTPGVLLKYSKPEFVEAFNTADLIIAKGQGNFESLSDTERPICFLLRVKCHVISKLLNGAEKGSLHVIHRNIQ
jgi:uncharacterized protein with ATP-grasp and redox domains